VRLGAVVSAAFLGVFAATGLVFSYVSRGVVTVVPWLALAVGEALAQYGVVVLAGRGRLAVPGSPRAARASPRRGAPGAPTGAAAAEGQPLPELTFTRFRTGQTERLAVYRGQPLVINFFASWCAPCLVELPRFEEAYQAHQGKVAFLGVNLQDHPESARRVIADTGYPVAEDPNGRLFQALGGTGMPTTVFVDADGTIIERHTGELTGRQLSNKLQTPRHDPGHRRWRAHVTPPPRRPAPPTPLSIRARKESDHDRQPQQQARPDGRTHHRGDGRRRGLLCGAAAGARRRA
jgi:thiol-disulfide isomerase/thioredoxin